MASIANKYTLFSPNLSDGLNSILEGVVPAYIWYHSLKGITLRTATQVQRWRDQRQGIVLTNVAPAYPITMLGAYGGIPPTYGVISGVFGDKAVVQVGPVGGNWSGMGNADINFLRQYFLPTSRPYMAAYYRYHEHASTIYRFSLMNTSGGSARMVSRGVNTGRENAFIATSPSTTQQNTTTNTWADNEVSFVEFYRTATDTVVMKNRSSAVITMAGNNDFLSAIASLFFGCPHLPANGVAPTDLACFVLANATPSSGVRDAIRDYMVAQFS